MEFLLWAGFAGLVLFGLLASIGYAITSLVIKGNVHRAGKLLGPLGPDEYEETAAMVEGGRGFGVLRLTAAELRFANAVTGELVLIPLDLLTLVSKDVSVSKDLSVSKYTDLGGDSGELPDPVLLIATGSADQVARTAFAVSRADDWIARINTVREISVPSDSGPGDGTSPKSPRPNDSDSHPHQQLQAAPVQSTDSAATRNPRVRNPHLGPTES